jgi:hypothetical protein
LRWDDEDEIKKDRLFRDYDTVDISHVHNYDAKLEGLKKQIYKSNVILTKYQTIHITIAWSTSKLWKTQKLFIVVVHM